MIGRNLDTSVGLEIGVFGFSYFRKTAMNAEAIKRSRSLVRLKNDASLISTIALIATWTSVNFAARRYIG